MKYSESGEKEKKVVEFYAGIGSRQTPVDVIKWMTRIATYLSDRGYILRSGNAVGADTAFQRGAKSKEVYLPWRGYNGGSEDHVQVSRDIVAKAIKEVIELHPAGRGLTTSALSLHSRNLNIMLGAELDKPSKFVLYWNPVYKKTGGTYMATVFAMRNGIPIYNLAIDREVEEFMWTYKFEDFPTREEEDVE